jgi:hypothetical protein
MTKEFAEEQLNHFQYLIGMPYVSSVPDVIIQKLIIENLNGCYKLLYQAGYVHPTTGNSFCGDLDSYCSENNILFPYFGADQDRSQ